MNKENNPTITRFNRNAFVESAAKQEPSKPESVSIPTFENPKPDSKPSSEPFNASERLAELRAEAMKSVDKTIMSQIGLKKPSSVARPQEGSVRVNITPKARPVATSAPVSSDALQSALRELPDDLLSKKEPAVQRSRGLSLGGSPTRTRQQQGYSVPASRPAAKAVPRSTAKPAPAQLVSHNLANTPVANKANLTKLVSQINGNDVPSKDYKSVLKNDRLKKRAHKVTKKQKIIGGLLTATLTLMVGAYVVYLSVPDLAVKIAASQAGLDVAYPSTVVQGFVMSDVSSSKDGEVIINYTNKSQSYRVAERKSSWDSDALLNNFVIPNWGSSYNIIREKGLTIYVTSGRAAWVSGGNQFIIDASSAGLSNDQLRSIALSM